MDETNDILNQLKSSAIEDDTYGYLNDIKSLISGNEECGKIMNVTHNHKTPTIFVNVIGLSVLRDFEGKYRGIRSSSGAFDTSCD